MAQRPITYQGVRPPSLYVPRSSTISQVPAGVAAFQEATTSVAAGASRWTGEVQVAYSQEAVVPVCGSAYSVRPAGRPITMPGRPSETTFVPRALPWRQAGRGGPAVVVDEGAAERRPAYRAARSGGGAERGGGRGRGGSGRCGCQGGSQHGAP